MASTKGSGRADGKTAAVRDVFRPIPDARLLRVAVAFFVTYSVLQTAVWYLGYRGSLRSLMLFTAQTLGSLVDALGVSARVVGNDVVLATRILRIDVDCTGISLLMLYSALVLAYPLRAKWKFMGLAMGIPVLFLANLTRLIAVAMFSNMLSDKVFLFVHDYLFKIVMMGVVIGLWALFLQEVRRRAR